MVEVTRRVVDGSQLTISAELMDLERVRSDPAGSPVRPPGASFNPIRDRIRVRTTNMCHNVYAVPDVGKPLDGAILVWALHSRRSGTLPGSFVPDDLSACLTTRSSTVCRGGRCGHVELGVCPCCVAALRRV